MFQRFILATLLAALLSPVERCAAVDSIALADFEWFSKLGFPDIQGRQFVRIATGSSIQSNGQPPENRYTYGFLLATSGNRFTILTLGLATSTFTNSAPGTAEYLRVGWEAADLNRSVGLQLDLLHHQQPDDYARDFNVRLNDRAEAFVLAWACWQRGLDPYAQELYVKARDAKPRIPDSHHDPVFRIALEKDFADVLMWRAMDAFGRPAITRAELLHQFEAISLNYPDSEHCQRAAQMAVVLRRTIAEDIAHEKSGPKNLDRLPTTEKVRELIFRLRDQNAHQVSNPGYCEIFTDWETINTNTPAHQLAALGYAAAPQLIEALDSPTPSRSTGESNHSGGWKPTNVQPGYVLTVGDCAEQVLQRITGKSFSRDSLSAKQQTPEEHATASKKAAQSWWTEFQKKGEQQMLVDDVATLNNYDARAEAALLRQKYPDAAVSALIRGIRAATDSSLASEFIRQLALLDRPEGAEFLKEEVRTGASLELRVEAAFALRQREKEFAIDAMIQEWQTVPEQITKNNEWAWVIDFLGTCDSPRAVTALANNLRQHLPEMRQRVVQLLGSDCDWHFEPAYTNLPPSADTLNAIEKCLVMELADGEESYRSNERNNWNPRIADIAAYYLASRWPDRYTFNLAATYKNRERQCIACMNVWRTAHGLSLLQFPTPHTPPLPPSQALNVTSIQWSPDSVPPTPSLAAQLASFNRNRLDADALVRLLVDFVRNPQPGARGLSLAITKDADLAGVQITAGLIRGKRDATITFWGEHECIMLGTDDLLDGNGGVIASIISDPKRWEHFRDAVNRAIAGDPQVPFEIDIRVASESP